MTDAEKLQLKIKAHLSRLEEARTAREDRRAKTQEHARGLFSGISIALKEIEGLTVTMKDLDQGLEDDWLEINLLDQVVRFSVVDRQEEFCVEVTGLYDRTLEFKLQPGFKWIASDDRGSVPITYSEELLFKRLTALVPD
ncbi:hypothetical protein [Pseudomonas protegens]|uniref:hypothetical protein n=1 Tax=Pseudomonas TaxID=286 RepID=UPI001146AFAC|nr:hypothetical protein [Pseudomonas protegens]